MINISIRASLLILTFFAPGVYSQDTRPSIADCVVRLTFTNGRTGSSGSAVIVYAKDGIGMALTAHHVLEMGGTGAITLNDGRKVSAIVLKRHSHEDLAAVKFEYHDVAPPKVGLAKTLPRPGTQVWKVGYPAKAFGGSPRDVRTGQVVRVETRIQTSAIVNPGDSGGGFFNDEGRLVGIITHHIGDHKGIGPGPVVCYSFSQQCTQILTQCPPGTVCPPIIGRRPPGGTMPAPPASIDERDIDDPPPSTQPIPRVNPAPVPQPPAIPPYNDRLAEMEKKIQGIIDRIDKLKSIPGTPGIAGKDGTSGKDGTNGLDGQPGLPGKDGKPGVDGKNGVDGLPGPPGKDGKDGKDGVAGIQGPPGKDGQPADMSRVEALERELKELKGLIGANPNLRIRVVPADQP